MRQLEFENKKVLVTGSSRGIGKTITEFFDKEGAISIYHASSSNSLNRITEEKAKAVIDLEYPDSAVDKYEKLFRRENGIDILVLNAGIGESEVDLDMKNDYLKKLIKINIESQILLIQKHLSLCKEYNMESSLVYISSMTSEIPRTLSPYYSMSKKAVSHFVKIMSQFYNDHKVRMNIIAPGSIKTDMTLKSIESLSEDKKITLSESEVQLYSGINSFKKMGKTSDVANTVLFLSSKRANFINGETIAVNGGYLYV